MAVPIRFAIELLKKAGWKSAEELQQQQSSNSQVADANTNPATQK